MLILDSPSLRSLSSSVMSFIGGSLCDQIFTMACWNLFLVLFSVLMQTLLLYEDITVHGGGRERGEGEEERRGRGERRE